MFFAPASAEMTPTALRVLDVAAPLVVGLPEHVSIEGHANVIPVSGRYATNWELSSDRATQVLRHLVEADGLPGGRIRPSATATRGRSSRATAPTPSRRTVASTSSSSPARPSPCAPSCPQ